MIAAAPRSWPKIDLGDGDVTNRGVIAAEIGTPLH